MGSKAPGATTTAPPATARLTVFPCRPGVKGRAAGAVTMRPVGCGDRIPAGVPVAPPSEEALSVEVVAPRGIEATPLVPRPNASSAGVAVPK